MSVLHETEKWETVNIAREGEPDWFVDIGVIVPMRYPGTELFQPQDRKILAVPFNVIESEWKLALQSLV